jgi:hypothetical protein
MKIYTPRVSNDHLSLLPCSTDDGLSITSVLNMKPLLDGWKIVDFEFKAFRRSGKKKPDVTLLGGGFAFRRELKNLIFPLPCPELEFLPILASGDEWLVTNCLKATKQYNNENSIIFRRGVGQIYLINHIIVEDPSLEQCEIFVVEDSNRTTLLALPKFVERITKLGLSGIEFKEIGALTQG